MNLALLTGFLIPSFDSTLEIANLILNISKPIERILQAGIFFEKFLIIRNGAIKPIIQRTRLRAVLRIQHNLRVIVVILNSTKQLR